MSPSFAINPILKRIFSVVLYIHFSFKYAFSLLGLCVPNNNLEIFAYLDVKILVRKVFLRGK